MLYNISPLLGPDALAILRAMGHSDDSVVADANFPAASHARRLIRVDGADGPRLVEAILALCPLDSFVPNAVFSMQQEHAPDELAPICGEYRSPVQRIAGPPFDVVALDRFAFYERTTAVFAVLVTGETRLYANLLLKKGIVRHAA